MRQVFYSDAHTTIQQGIANPILTFKVQKVQLTFRCAFTEITILFSYSQKIWRDFFRPSEAVVWLWDLQELLSVMKPRRFSLIYQLLGQGEPEKKSNETRA